jgi:1-acyl-sn-glycerol-3-phosphate acyltransferase
MPGTDHAPSRPRTLLQRFALGLLSLAGWRSSFVWPPEPRGVIVVYPHTSNWDFPIGVLFRIGNGLPANWVGKAEMFREPFRRLLEAIGGIALDRRASVGFVEALLQEYRRRDWMWVAIAVEGTRSHTDSLKSGFYHLATGGDMPVALAYIDYGSKTVGMDTYVRFTGDRERDMETMRQFYAGKRGRRPELAGDIRLKG